MYIVVMLLLRSQSDRHSAEGQSVVTLFLIFCDQNIFKRG